jgi:cytochrome c553
MTARLPSFVLLAAVASTARGVERGVSFEKDVRPILKAHCTQCHGEEEKPKGGVDLRLRRFMDKELEDGAHVLVPGKPDKSEMILLVREGEMPRKGKPLTPEQIAVLEKWIAQGAKTTRPEPATLPPGAYVAEDDREFWSFKPITRPAVPTVPEAQGSKSKIRSTPSSSRSCGSRSSTSRPKRKRRRSSAA